MVTRRTRARRANGQPSVAFRHSCEQHFGPKLLIIELVVRRIKAWFVRRSTSIVASKYYQPANHRYADSKFKPRDSLVKYLQQVRTIAQVFQRLLLCVKYHSFAVAPRVRDLDDPSQRVFE